MRPASPDRTDYPTKKIVDLIAEERLPADFEETVRAFYSPLAISVAAHQEKLGRQLTLGINGPQGSGKSTLAKFLGVLLTTAHKKRVAVLSLDDFYLTKDARATLAQTIHPLLATRGVPGTHDTELCKAVLSKLKSASPEDVTSIPRFDKAADDRAPEDQWTPIAGAPEIIIFEGWCVGASPQSENDLSSPLNDLEREEDADGRWRHYVNTSLAGDYTQLFSAIDMLVYFNPLGFERVFNWRQLQEQKLREANAQGGAGIMSDDQLRRFMSHYERLTRHMMKALPNRADIVFDLGADQQIQKMR